MTEPTPAGPVPDEQPASPQPTPDNNSPTSLPPEWAANTPPADDISKTYDLMHEVLSNDNLKRDSERFHEATRQSMGWGDTLGEIGPAVMNGVEDFGSAVSTPILNTLAGTNRGYATEERERTVTGSISHFIGQQLPALIPATKALTLGREAWAGSELFGSTFAKSGLATLFTHAAADLGSAAIAFGGKQPKLADSLYPILQDTKVGPLFDALRTDPEGSEAMNRFRNGIDNMGMGLAMTGLLKLGGIVFRRLAARETGVAAETVAKNFADDFSTLRAEHPEVERYYQQAKEAAPHLSDGEIAASYMGIAKKLLGEDGSKRMEDLAKVITFANGDNEAKAEAVDKQLAAEKVDQEFNDYYAQNGRRMEAESKLADNTLPPGHETLVTPPPYDSDLRKFNAVRKGEMAANLPSSGETLVTPPRQQPLGPYQPKSGSTTDSIIDVTPSPSTNGWKLHLGVPSGNREAVDSTLKDLGLTYKAGHNSGQAGKDFTVYIGHRDQAESVAKKLHDLVGNLLDKPSEDVVRDDRKFAGNVFGRFDISREDPRFHQYGQSGIPFFEDDKQKAVWDRENFDATSAQSRADAELKSKYGNFYAGTPPLEPKDVNIPVRPNEDQAALPPIGLPGPSDDAKTALPEPLETQKFLMANSPRAQMKALPAPSTGVTGVGTIEAAPSVKTFIGQMYQRLSNEGKWGVARGYIKSLMPDFQKDAEAEGLKLGHIETTGQWQGQRNPSFHVTVEGPEEKVTPFLDRMVRKAAIASPQDAAAYSGVRALKAGEVPDAVQFVGRTMSHDEAFNFPELARKILGDGKAQDVYVTQEKGGAVLHNLGYNGTDEHDLTNIAEALQKELNHAGQLKTGRAFRGYHEIDAALDRTGEGYRTPQDASGHRGDSPDIGRGETDRLRRVYAERVESAVLQKARAEGVRLHEDDLDALDVARETRLKEEARAAGKSKAEVDAIKVDTNHPDSIWHSVPEAGHNFIDETEPEPWADNWPVLGNTRRATQGLDDTGKQAFHTVRAFVAEFKDADGNPAFPTPKQIISGMKARAAALDKADFGDLKARLANLKPADVDDMLDRIDAYYGGNEPVPVPVADVAGIKPKAEVVDVNGEPRTVQTYSVPSDGREVRVHAEHLPDGKYGLSVSVPNNAYVNDETRVGWKTIDLQKKVDRAGLQQAIADAATQSQRYYKIGADGRPQGWAEAVDGRGVIGLFKTADVSTLVHELTHTADLLGFAPEFFGRMRKALGFAANDTSREAREAVANTFERFAFHGELDDPALRPGMKKLSEFMSAIYKDVEKTPAGLEITEPVRMAFRGLGGLSAIGDNVGVRPEVEELKARLKDTDFNDPVARQAIFDKATDTYLNLGTIRGDDAQTVMAQLTDVFDHVIQSDRGGVETHDAAVKDAVSMMLNNGGDLSTLTELTRGAEHLRDINGKFLYWRGMTQSWANQVAKTLKALRTSPDDAGLQKQFEIAFDSFTRMRLVMQDLQTESARLLGKHKIVMPEVPIDGDLVGVGYAALMDADKKSGGKLLNQFDSLMRRADGDPFKTARSITDVTRSVKNKTYMNLAKSLYMSSILSHPRVVLGVQFLGGLVGSVTKPAQYIAGGLAHMDPESVRFGLDLYKNLAHTVWDFATLSAEGKEPMRDVGRTFWNGSSVSEHNAIPYLRPSDVYTGMSGVVKQSLDGTYAVATSPLRVMNTLDEMYRQLYGRAYLRTRGMDEAFAQGLKHGTPEFEDAVQKFVRAGFDSDGSILDPQTIRELQDLTFKRPLNDSTNPYVRGINAFMKLPGMWLFQPLLRAPVNIGREAAMSIPGIQYMSNAFREGLASSNPRIAAAYRGRQIMGLMTFGFFGMLAYNGNITGSGPSRSTAKGKRWYDAGYQPYSFVIHNGDGTVKSIGYQQIEPFSTVAGLCANAVEALDQSDIPDDKKVNAAAALAAGLSKTWSDKRYLTGMAAALQLVNGDSAGAERSFAQIASGAIPLSGAQAYVSDLTDDNDFKHTQGLLEQIQNRTIFKSELEPRRDFFGKPVESLLWNNISPLPVRDSSGDPVAQELLSLGNRVPDTSSGKLRGIDLTTYRNAKGQSAYDRRSELRQEVKLGGYTLHDNLARLMASASYKKLDGDFDALKNERADRVLKVVEQYNAAVQTKLLGEFPDLKRAFNAADPMAKRQQQRKAVAALTAIPK